MLLIDRHIFLRFISNFAILLLLLFVFAASIDVILNLEDFVEAARLVAGEGASAVSVALGLARSVADFEGPRLFQFYAYLHGMTAVGAMGFTLSQMHRHRELVAVMASGVSLYRVAMPFLVGMFVLSVAQLLNQELVLPRIAPLLLRDYKHLGEGGVESFQVQFTPDGNGTLFQSPSYDPQTQTMNWPSILERDESGRTARRIAARSAKWSDAAKAWMLEEGIAVQLKAGEASSDRILHREPVPSYHTDLTPHVLLVRRYNQFASMLSMDQIGEMLDTTLFTERDMLLRYRYSRFSSVLANVLVLALALPCFLLREPANLVKQSVLCASLAIPASVGAALGMMVQLPGIPPAVSVFLPVIVLMFMSLFPWTFFKT